MPPETHQKSPVAHAMALRDAVNQALTGWIIGISGAVDAYRGAGRHKAMRRPREVPNELWAMLVVVTVLVTVAVVTSTPV
jgi:hypothetical protein